MILHEIKVPLKHQPHSILIGTELESTLAQLCQELKAQNRRWIVITDESIDKAINPFITNSFGEFRRLVIPSGETSKSFDAVEALCEELAQEAIDRKGVIFNIGGGVIGDIGGFVASCYLRGIDFYHVPTTLLAMVDSSIGGKSGINLSSGKNLVGAFNQPKGVIIDLNLLKTLPKREFHSGMAEVIKYGLLGETVILETLEKHPALTPEHDDLSEIIKRSCEMKVAIVVEDEKEESGTRGLLNLGHTFCHAIEAIAGYGTYLHGEALGIGLVMMGRLSQELGYIDHSQVEHIKSLVKKYDLPVKLHKPLEIDALMHAMQRDKKSVAGKIRFIVMKGIGQISIEQGVDLEIVKKLWKEFGAK